MGKAVKTILPVALLAGGAYFGLSGLGALKSGAGLGGGAKDLFGLALGFGGAGAQIMQSNIAMEGIKFQEMQAKQEQQMAKLAGEQDVLAIKDERRRIRANSIAMGAALGQGQRGKSFQAYLKDIDYRSEQDIKNTRLNALVGRRTHEYELAQLGSARRATGVGGYIGATRSLLTTAFRGD